MGTLSRVKQAFASPDPNALGPYECQGCGTRFRREYYVCPKCGGYSLDRAEWSS
jgi:rubrerythrin